MSALCTLLTLTELALLTLTGPELLTLIGPALLMLTGAVLLMLIGAALLMMTGLALLMLTGPALVAAQLMLTGSCGEQRRQRLSLRALERWRAAAAQHRAAPLCSVVQEP